ncbi:hypothetical protein D2A34_15915 [Clostridium chromiireducens]|uniref:Uncharacterized protein n=2 Tax=Clostridium chromiireducens TaxID=225345 RepID=A0A1V4I3G2_9CLOT|nr:hypothetical protein [Clostridium chromiireducens]OPJ54522.1 hypothetical protein CLCHR_48690 [Clostridium chromiireducens]RII33237.1 hypothetical protein D2A34_15915 [Clostridium chromiireducens]
MTTAYDLFKKLLGVMADIDRYLDEKSKVTDSRTIQMLDQKIDSLETEMYEIRNKLKSIEIK